MWKRRTFYECADELKAISEDFRAAYTNKFSFGEEKRNQILQDTSKRGVEVLRILALSVRSEQDYQVIPKNKEIVGALKHTANENEIVGALEHYTPPYNNKDGFEPLLLREALNKIAHADPDKTSFFASESVHDLILCGKYVRGNNKWIAIISLIDFCNVIKSLPDHNLETENRHEGLEKNKR